ncbi:MAG: DEAD/DEAH box helicase [Clostridiales bacterium]|nr:DEAD/DEAH box helicase [Clostridiales bacterium]
MTQQEDFTKMDLSVEILKALEKQNISTPTAVQQQTIPLMMEGRDVMGIAPTGTGKTIAFGIPMLEYVNLKDQRIQEVVLCPTRELALQIADEIRKMAVFIPQVRVAVLYGGQPIVKQLNQLKRKPQIVIATPGRMLDHMQRNSVQLHAVHTMVLDEADEMLKMGFVKDVAKIIEAAPITKQLVMFSATTNQDVMTIAWRYQTNPVEIIVEATKENRPSIKQYVITIGKEGKYEDLLYLLDSDEYKKVMVFCNTKSTTQWLTTKLEQQGYQVGTLHGDMRQTHRNQAMQSFRKGRFNILVATDVAARGIDIDDVEAVINYDLPQENEYYLHRIGRTGRAKRHGVAFSLITFAESIRMDEILKYIIADPVPLHFNEMQILVDEQDNPFFKEM